MPLSISVALCTYNSERYIEAQLRSILTQSLRPDEIIVGDDGSTDATLTLIRELVAREGKGTRLTVLPAGDRLGVTANFERTVAACTGDLIALSDHDDVWHVERLAWAVPAFETDPGLLLQHADARLVDADGEPLGVSLLRGLTVSAAERNAIDDGRAFEAYIRRNLATGATVLFRRTLLEAALPFPAEWVHDEWLAIIAAATGRVQLLDREVTDYRQHGANQIGVAAPTLRYRIGRMLEPRGDRLMKLSTRSRALVNRLDDLAVPDATRRLARDKAVFETIRAAYPTNRVRRVPRVLAQWRAGTYPRLASQGTLDVVRDLLQRA